MEYYTVIENNRYKNYIATWRKILVMVLSEKKSKTKIFVYYNYSDVKMIYTMAEM